MQHTEVKKTGCTICGTPQITLTPTEGAVAPPCPSPDGAWWPAQRTPVGWPLPPIPAVAPDSRRSYDGCRAATMTKVATGCDCCHATTPATFRRPMRTVSVVASLLSLARERLVLAAVAVERLLAIAQHCRGSRTVVC